MSLPRILNEMLSLPTAPFVEQAVMGWLQTTCGNLPGCTARTDRWGNFLVRYRRSEGKRTPVAFTAHTDHPGFAALKPAGPGAILAAFRGWVEPEYFDRAGVRFWSGGAWVKGRIEAVTKTARVYRMIGRTARPEQVRVAVEGAVAPGSPGMWDLPEPALKDGLVYARGIDDIAGCAAMVELLTRLSRRRAKADVYCLFTRAEEVGFVGAIGAAKVGTLPRRAPVIAIETSKALANAKIGDGPVLRVGDKSSVFTPEVTAFCNRVAIDLSERDKTFKYQRKLMDGGTCESTAYCAYGYAATGLCVPLGNYHNMDVERKRIDSEYISLADWEWMVQWFEAIATDREGFKPGADASMKQGLEKRFASYRKLL